ncbi:hypothetical protein QC763_402165 [Podospora pseudopauciseta]|uniref:Mid2 domain-containing protein n=1 Tax=Podospora pseudopauciseta TaxID=2093780 RepID=A0ABR0HCA7_9PEZI|nr:hypothetical protein QC763_402165 [Podospora pseudopauciseta]
MAIPLLSILCFHAFNGLSQASFFSRHTNATTLIQQKRQGTVLVTKYFTLFSTSNPSSIRTANTGFDCRVDLIHDLWGFCPTSVISATDCGLAGSCVDKHGCSVGCGSTNAALTTFTCSGALAPFCSTALLTLPNNVGPFTYLACGKGPSTDNYFAFTTRGETTTISTMSMTRLLQDTSTSASSAILPTLVDSLTSDPGFPTSSNERTSQSNTKSDGNTQPNNTGAIVGGVIGSFALLCASGIAIVWLLRRNRNKSAIPSSKPHTNSTPEHVDQKSADHKVATWTHYNNAGWGPQELPAHHHGAQNTDPVELPAVYQQHRP